LVVLPEIFFPPYCPPPANILPDTPPLVIYRRFPSVRIKSTLLSFFFESFFKRKFDLS
jgi:hypothetical protein